MAVFSPRQVKREIIHASQREAFTPMASQTPAMVRALMLTAHMQAAQNVNAGLEADKIGIMQDPGDSELDVLSPHFRLVQFDPGSTVIQSGHVGTVFMFIIKGSFEVRIGGKKGELLETKRPGQYVGESAFMQNHLHKEKVRSADIFTGPFGGRVIIMSFQALEVWEGERS